MIDRFARFDAILTRLAETRPAALLAIALFALVLFLPGFASLPVTDRDEARFAQASRQMAETGDLVDIRLGEGTRYQKPAGIYWLQSAAVAITGEAREIWVYRLPSLLSAVAAAMLTYLVALRLVGAEPAFLAGLLMAASLTLGAEARIAKTDAALLVTILLAQWPLVRLHMTGLLPRPVAWGFWAALGASVLVKGPVGLMVVALTVAALSPLKRNVRWLAPLRPLEGLVVFAAIVVPWYLAITLTAGWDFWQAGLVGDFLSKIGQGMESHGAPPGSFALGVWLIFWPAAIVLPAGLWLGWRGRADPGVQFCVAWALPAWIAFELTATKLPHYILPLLPALAILSAAGWHARTVLPGLSVRIGAVAVLALGLVVAAAPFAFAFWMGSWPGLWWIAGVVLMLAGAVLFWRPYVHGLTFGTIPGMGLMAVGAALAVYVSLARFEPMWASEALAAQVRAAPCPAPQVYAVGYPEASLMFLTDTLPRPVDAVTAAQEAAASDCAVVVLDTRLASPFEEALAEIEDAGEPVELGTFEGFSLGAAERVEIRTLAFTSGG